MNQEALNFDAPKFTPLSRRSDPKTSVDAGRKVARTGVVKRHEELIIQCLELNGPSTAKEMQYYMTFHRNPEDRLTSVEISRRSGGLIHTEPYRCQYTGTRNGFKIWQLIK